MSTTAITAPRELSTFNKSVSIARTSACRAVTSWTRRHGLALFLLLFASLFVFEFTRAALHFARWSWQLR